MPPHILAYRNGQHFCTTSYEEANRWVRTIWHGFVTAQDGESGALQTLKMLGITHAPYLLNDNSQIEGPWFDSVEWLERVWAPQARQLGLRFVAHVMQPDPNPGLDVTAGHRPFDGLFELQLFATVGEAEIWLHEQQTTDSPLLPTSCADETR